MRGSLLPDFEAYPADRYALVQPRELVTGAVIVEYGWAVVEHPAWQPGFTEVWDLTLSKGVDAVPSDIPQVVAAEKAIGDRLKGSATLIISNRSLIYNAVQLYAALMRPLGRRVIALNSQADAARHLGIEALPILTR